LLEFVAQNYEDTKAYLEKENATAAPFSKMDLMEWVIARQKEILAGLITTEANTLSGGTTNVVITATGGATTVAGGATTVAGGATTVAGMATTIAGTATTVAGTATTVAGTATTATGAATTVADNATTIVDANSTTVPAGRKKRELEHYVEVIMGLHEFLFAGGSQLTFSYMIFLLVLVARLFS
jgi:hypothetical protein